MNVFFDTSALLAVYVKEARSARARAALRGNVFVSTLTYAEALAGLARLGREGVLSDAARATATARFLEGWVSFSRSALDARILPEVRRVLKFHPLSGADAVQLATALFVSHRLGGGLLFASSDRKLVAAAREEGLEAGL